MRKINHQIKSSIAVVDRKDGSEQLRRAIEILNKNDCSITPIDNLVKGLLLIDHFEKSALNKAGLLNSNIGILYLGHPSTQFLEYAQQSCHDFILDDFSEEEFFVRIHRLERKLTESISLAFDFRKIFENAEIGIVTADLDGNLVSVNPAFARLMGYKPDELYQVNFRNFTFEEDLSQELPLLTKLVKGEISSYKLDRRYKHKDGHVVWVKIHVSTIANAAGYPEFLIGVMDDISDEISQEAELQKGKYRFEQFSKVTFEGIILHKDGICIDCNERITEISGYSRESLIGHNVIEKFVAHQSRDAVYEHIQSRSTKPYEIYVKRRGGGFVPVEVESKQFVYNGEAVRVVAVRNITERKKAELEINKLKTAIMQTNNSVVITDKDGIIEFINPAFTKITGYTLEEAKGRKPSIIKSDFHDDHYYKSLWATISSGRTWQGEFLNISKSGKKFWERANISPIRDEHGEITHYMALKENITEKKMAEEALENSESNLRNILKIIPDIIFIIDRHGVFKNVFVDDESKLMMPPSQFLGKSVSEVLPSAFAHDIMGWIEKTLKSRQIEQFEYSAVEHGKRLNFEARMMIFGENDLFVIIRDITMVRTSIEELKKSKDLAESANKSKSAFLANMSHEIRTPMNAVLGFTDLLLSEIKDSRYASYLESIKTSGNTLLNLINDILDLSKIEAGKMIIRNEPTNLKAVVEEIKNMFGIRARQKEISLKLEYDDSIPSYLMLDDLRIRQVLLNLVGNAVKFTNQGSVEIVIKNTTTTTQRNAGYVDLRMDIKDTGIGIGIENQETIFEAFKQQDDQDAKKYAGTGLGLAITKRIVELMNGYIELTSAPDEGSTFSVFLPNIEVVLHQTDESAANIDLSNIRFKGQKILVVDDRSINLKLIASILQLRNLEVIRAKSGMEAIEKVAEEVPNVILLDTHMPVMDGFETIDQIWQIHGHEKFDTIALMPGSSQETLSEIGDRPFKAYLKKPVKEADLIKALANVLKYTIQGARKEQVEHSTTAVNSKVIKKATREKIKEVILPKWSKASESSSFKIIEEFGHELIDFGKENELVVLERLGRNLVQHVENFDVENIKMDLISFEDVLREYALEVKQ